jgi:hypothetical protein
LFQRFILVVILCLIPAGSVLGQGCLTPSDFPQVLGTFEHSGGDVYGSRRAPAFMGSTLFIPYDDAGVSILQVTDADQVMDLGMIPVIGETINVAVSDSTLFVADHFSGFRVFDIRDPAAPVLINQIIGLARDVAVADGYLLVLGYSRWLNVYELKEGGQANYLRSIQLILESPQTFVHSGNLILVRGSGNDFVTVDVSDPGFPVERQHFDLERTVKSYDLHEGIAVFSLWNRPMEIWGLSDPDHPNFISSCADFSASYIQILDELVFFGASQYGIGAIDIADIQNPRIVYRHNSPPGYYYAFGLFDDRLLAIRDQAELIDFSKRTSPEVHGEVPIPNSWAGRCVVLEDLAIVAAYNDSISIVSLADPANPKLTYTGQVAHDYVLTAKDHILYLQNGSSTKLFDISNPHLPQYIGSRSLGGVVQDFVVRDDLLIALHGTGFSLWDVSDPQWPQHLSGRELYNIKAGDLQGDHLYLACWENGLMVWDLSDLSDPTLVTTDPGIDWPTGVTATADALFVFNHFGESMQVFDISDPGQLVLRHTRDMISDADGGVVHGNLLTFRGRGYLIYNFDITDPFDPRFIGTFGRSERYFDVESNQNYMVLSGWPNNLEIYETPCDTHSSPPGSNRKETGLSLSVSPNPFNPRTRILYELPGPSSVGIEIFDLAGRRVFTSGSSSVMAAGNQEFVWEGKDQNGRQLPSGTYLFWLKAGEYSCSTRLVLLK